MAQVKKKEHENLTDSNIARVIGLLEADKPITKKEACEILNISYNTTRLSNIVEGYKKRLETEKRLKDRNKGKPATEEEIQTVISSYLKGSNISDISKSIYRSASFVKGIIDRLGVPQKLIGEDKYSTSILPDDCVKLEFSEGELAWSAKYHSPCIVIKENENTSTTNYEEKYGCKSYQIYIIEELEELVLGFPRVTYGGYYASSLVCDLGSLEHLSKYNVKFNV